MEQLSLVAALAAMLMSIAALLVSGGTAGRLHLVAKQSLVPEGLQAGARISHSTIANLIPSQVLEPLLAGPSLIVFASAKCKPCTELVDSMNRRDFGLSDQTLLMIDTGGNGPSELRQLGRFPSTWVTDGDRGLREAFKTNSTPTTYVVVHGIVQKQIVGANVDAIAAALDTARQSSRIDSSAASQPAEAVHS